MAVNLRCMAREVEGRVVGDGEPSIERALA
jgi:hypothetical protein